MPNRTLRQVVEGQTLISAPADTTVRAAAITMAGHKIGAIVVVDDQGRLAGLFTERDVLNRVVAQGLAPDSTRLTPAKASTTSSAAPCQRESTMRGAVIAPVRSLLPAS